MNFQGTGEVISVLDVELAAFIKEILTPTTSSSSTRSTVMLLVSDHGTHRYITLNDYCTLTIL
jgi:hypothetical protein